MNRYNADPWRECRPRHNPPANSAADADKPPPVFAVRGVINAANGGPVLSRRPVGQTPFSMPVVMAYGFNNVRNLANRDGKAKFTIDLLNRALNISHRNLSHRVIMDIWRGIRLQKTAVDRFAGVTGIDQQTAKFLLQSWADCLRDEYHFISIQNVLNKKTTKYDLSRLETVHYLCVKNFPGAACIEPAILNQLAATFQEFIKHGDYSGFHALARCDSSIKMASSSIISTLFFRRTSKLALKWSHDNAIPVNFDRNFSYKDAQRKSMKNYRPITFSEYCFYRKNRFNNVTEWQVVNNEFAAVFCCFGRRRIINPNG
ncbi:hypothetical protein [Martelella alba]|uniref:Uncharacterized protein n=1 Tax=Martelella alba TaxID=2590451 RepID=A0ABY2SN01_9HYPH|nr:hypothetical protein [Martelella alba]TKI06355.1 hypothetical protein FCN80_10995 [Martelella alba]